LLCQKFVEIVKTGGEDRDDRCIEMLGQGGLGDFWREGSGSTGRTFSTSSSSSSTQFKRPRTSKESSDGWKSVNGSSNKSGEAEQEEEKRYLQDVASLMAYPDPRKSPQAWLLDDGLRERVADALNTVILGEMLRATRSIALAR
jgi:hypothetical protein